MTRLRTPALAGTARGWTFFTRLLTLAVFAQAISAGRLLDGDSWARGVHRAVAGLLAGAVMTAAVVAVVRLRDDAVGRRFGLTLVSFGVALAVEYGLGAAAADDRGTLWLHIPLGVVLVGLATRLNLILSGEALT